MVNDSWKVRVLGYFPLACRRSTSPTSNCCSLLFSILHSSNVGTCQKGMILCSSVRNEIQYVSLGILSWSSMPGGKRKWRARNNARFFNKIPEIFVLFILFVSISRFCVIESLAANPRYRHGWFQSFIRWPRKIFLHPFFGSYRLKSTPNFQSWL